MDTLLVEGRKKSMRVARTDGEAQEITEVDTLEFYEKDNELVFWNKNGRYVYRGSKAADIFDELLENGFSDLRGEKVEAKIEW